jgi:hypothetical protein
MNTSLTQLSASVEAKRKALDSARTVWLQAKDRHAAAKAAVDEEVYQAGLIRSRGGPRRLAGSTAPPTAAEIAATAAAQALAATELRLTSAKAALDNAEAALLIAENRILDRWRHLRALEIMELQRTDAAPVLIASKLSELRAMCPPDTVQRLHQRFKLSSLVRDVLDDQPDSIHIDTPVDQLRGENGGDYEAKRASILRESETDTPLEAA